MSNQIAEAWGRKFADLIAGEGYQEAIGTSGWRMSPEELLIYIAAVVQYSIPSTGGLDAMDAGLAAVREYRFKKRQKHEQTESGNGHQGNQNVSVR